MSYLPRIACVAFLLLTSVAAQEEERLGKAYGAVDTIMKRLMRHHGTAGMAVVVTGSEGSLHAAYGGFADLKARRPVTPDTLYQIGSISKSFTAITLLQQQEHERFDPARPVSAWLPWFSVKTRFPPITCHHLLTHTAGIPANRDDMTHGSYQAWALRHQETAWTPGERFHYSNVGYQVLHLVLERVSGHSYAEAVRAGILQRCGMDATEPVIEASSRPRQAIGYRRLYDDRPAHRSHPLVESQFVEYGIGDGCIVATPEDLAAYARMLLGRGKGAKGRVLTEASFARFIQGGKHDYGYGMGVREVGDHTVLSHGGGMVGITSQLIVDLDAGLGVVAFANGPGDSSALARFALTAVSAARAGKEPPALPEPGKRRPPKNPERFAGKYRIPPQGDRVDGGDSLGAFVVVVEAGALVLVRGKDRISLEHVGGATFQTPHPDFDRFRLRFEGSGDKGFTYVTHGDKWYVNERYKGRSKFAVPAKWVPLLGHYRSYSPWTSNFQVIERRGKLIFVTAEGGETSVGEQFLTERKGGGFFLGKPPTPEVLRFDSIVDGRALRAFLSGHVFHRTP